MRRLLFAGLSANTMVLMLAAASMLILKRGCGVSDTNALLFSFVQFAASALFSFVCGKIAGKVGPRKVIIGVCIAELMIPVLWILAPQEGIAMRIFAFAAFAVLGAASISLSNSQAHYFLQSVPAGSRVVGSMLSAMIMSVLAGIAGMLLAGFILGHIVTGSPETAMMEYKTYFMIVFFISIPGVLLQLWLKPLPIELRKPIARGIPRENHK